MGWAQGSPLLYLKIHGKGARKMNLKKFLTDESGSTVEYLVRVTIIGLGSAVILFGILIACRQKGGQIIDAIHSTDF